MSVRTTYPIAAEQNCGTEYEFIAGNFVRSSNRQYHVNRVEMYYIYDVQTISYTNMV